MQGDVIMRAAAGGGGDLSSSSAAVQHPHTCLSGGCRLHGQQHQHHQHRRRRTVAVFAAAAAEAAFAKTSFADLRGQTVDEEVDAAAPASAATTTRLGLSCAAAAAAAAGLRGPEDSCLCESSSNVTSTRPPSSAPSVRRTKSLMRPASLRKIYPRHAVMMTSNDVCNGWMKWGGGNGTSFERKLSHELLENRLMGVLEEGKVLDHNGCQQSTGRQFFFEQPMKVFSRKASVPSSSPSSPETEEVWNSDDTSFSSSSGHHRHSSTSCQALKKGVKKLYNLEDFVLEKIGEGFFCEVFKVIHTGTGKVMVLKMNKHRSNRTAMLKEVELMNTLSHPNVLKYEAACVHDGQLHALTEYVNGGALDQFIQVRSNELSWIQRVTLAEDIARGVRYLHSKGYFHRDLTSKNILIRERDDGDRFSGPLRAVVADFGLAAPLPKSADDDRLPQVGSPYWMSPECLRGLFYDGQADVFSLGIVLCEMIALVEADPDTLPRTENFGVDYIAFSQLVDESCPPAFLKLAFSCVQINPSSRPLLDEILSELDTVRGQIDGDQNLSRKNSVKLNGGEETAKNNKPKDEDNATESQSKEDKEGEEDKGKILLQLDCSLSASIKDKEDKKEEKEEDYDPLLSPTPPSTPFAEVFREVRLLDPHYTPSPGPPGSINPFAQLPRRLAAAGSKIHADLCCSCFELPSPQRRKRTPSTSNTNSSSTNSSNSTNSSRRSPSSFVRKSVSMIDRDHDAVRFYDDIVRRLQEARTMVAREKQKQQQQQSQQSQHKQEEDMLAVNKKNEDKDI